MFLDQEVLKTHVPFLDVPYKGAPYKTYRVYVTSGSDSHFEGRRTRRMSDLSVGGEIFGFGNPGCCRKRHERRRGGLKGWLACKGGSGVRRPRPRSCACVGVRTPSAQRSQVKWWIFGFFTNLDCNITRAERGSKGFKGLIFATELERSNVITYLRMTVTTQMYPFMNWDDN